MYGQHLFNILIIFLSIISIRHVYIYSFCKNIAQVELYHALFVRMYNSFSEVTTKKKFLKIYIFQYLTRKIGWPIKDILSGSSCLCYII